MSWLDAFFFGYSIQVLGVPFPHENVLNFTGAVVGSDDVANGRTTVNVTGGGGGGGITALTGDVTASGTGSVAATVAGIQGNSVLSTPPLAAQILIENSGATGSAWTTVSGDSTLSAAGVMVNTKLNTATVPAAGSLTIGNGLYVSGASALSYSALNLAGGAGYVTGALPAGNIAPGSGDQLLETNHAGATAWFSPGGDLTLASNSFSVVSLAGSSGTTVANSSVTPGTDNTYTAGTAAKRWASISAVTYDVFAASGDSIAASVLTAGALTLGVGGSTALDTRVRRTAAKTLTLDDGAGGTSGVELFVGGTTTTQLGITGSGLTFAAGVTAPTFTQTVVSGTGATNGVTTTIQAQAGQAQSSSNANNNGGALVLQGGAPGTGGSGTAGTAGQVNIYSGATQVGFFSTSVAGAVGLSLGATPASTTQNGLRLTSNQGVTMRNQANTLDLNIITTFTGSDQIIVGDFSSSSMLLRCGTNDAFNFESNSTNFFAISVTSSGPYANWTSAITSPTFGQTAAAQIAANGSAGTTLNVTAQAGQAATGVSHNGGAGGNLALLAGAGGASVSATAGIGGLITQFCGQAWQQITKAGSTYSVDTNSTASDLVIFTDSTSNTVTITLPAPSAGRLIYVKDKTGKAATHNVTISQHSAETIDGASSLTLSKNYDAVLLLSDGTNWSIIGEYAGSII